MQVMSPSGEASPNDRVESIDLDSIETDLADVERALERLEDGSYWTDEVTGVDIDPAHLEKNPTVRRNHP